MKLVNIQPEGKARQNLDESMIPAINIVFLLLIFFMIAGHIEARDHQLQVPESTSDMNLNTLDVEIKVGANGDYYLNGAKVTESFSDHFNALNLTNESTVTCYVDRNLPASSLDPVLESVRQSGIKHLLIATVQQ